MTVNSLVDYSRLCFYANVRGPGITDKSEACEPTVGLFAGGVGPGSQIQMEIPVGKDRVIEIYGVLRNSAQDTCWKSTDPVTRPTVDKFYFLGSSEAVEILPPSAEVSVSVQVPSVSQNIAVVNGWNSCPMATPVPVVQNETVGRPVLAAATLTGSQFKMKMQVSSKSEAFVQSGSQFKIKSWFNKGD